MDSVSGIRYLGRGILLAVLVAAASVCVAAADCRVIEHAMGQSCVPLRPERVVVLGTGELDAALALGLTPVGAVTPYEIGRFPEYLRDDTQSIMRVGTWTQPDLERIVALKPDLILSSRERHATIYDQLSAIAPTVFSADIGASWKDNLRLFAQALGRAERGESVLNQYHTKLTRLHKALTDSASLPTVSLVRGMPDHVRIYLKDSFSGSILSDAGLPRPPAQQGEGFVITLRSPDTIGQLSADVVLVSFYGAKESTLLYDWMHGPFWPLLAATSPRAVHQVDDSYWMLGLGPLAAIRIVGDLQHILTDG